jgi:hypothetical protein
MSKICPLVAQSMRFTFHYLNQPELHASSQKHDR